MNPYRVPLRLPPEWKPRIRAIADREHRSLHAQLLTWVERGLAQDADDTDSRQEPKA